MLRLLIVLTLGLAPGFPFAGAWPMPEGEAQLIITNTRKAARPSAVFQPDTETTRSEVSVFAEYGATADTTLGLVIFAGFSAADVEDTELRIGGHVRHRVWTGDDGDVASVEIGASFPAERWLGEGLGDDRPDSVSEAYLNLQYGRGWQLSWTDAFVSVGAEYRTRGEDTEDELQFFGSGGLRPTDSLMALFYARWVRPFGEDGDETFDLSPSIAWTLNPWLGSNDKKPEGIQRPVTLQLGITWDAHNPDDGFSVNFGVWRRF
ncbi:MAG: hypothetical protein AAFP68_06940 [Pseudomonadota bacterium]